MSARKPTDIEKIEALRTALRHIQTLTLGMEHQQDCCAWLTSMDSLCDCGRNAILQTAGKAL
jgi:hypothetical protein